MLPISEIITETNAIIESNKSFFVSVGVPLATAIVAFFSALFVRSAKRAETKMTGKVKLAEYRSQNYDKLLLAIAELLSILKATQLESFLSYNRSEEFKVDIQTLLRVEELVTEVEMRARSDLTLAVQFYDAADKVKDSIWKDSFDSESFANLKSLKSTCGQIIVLEWKVLERELKDL